MTAPSRRRKLSRTCDITRAPATGETGVTAVVTGLACTNPFPASRETRSRPELATVFDLWEIMGAEASDVENNDTLTLDDGRVFNIIKANSWTPGATSFVGLTHFILESVDA